MRRIIGGICIVFVLCLAGFRGIGQDCVISKVPVSDSVWNVVKKWPGLVGEQEKRLAEVRVEIDGVFRRMHPSSRFSLTGHRPWFSTGLYAAPCEMITVRKPASLNGRKIVCRIGASGSVLREDNKPWKRLPKTFAERELKDNDTTCIYNVNGGNVYIISQEPFERPETFVFGGVVKSPDFILGKTDPEIWKKEIAATTVPFAEIGCKGVIWTMSTDILKTADDPKELMEFYDDALKTDFNAFHGLSDTTSSYLHRSPEFPCRCVQDIQIHVGAAYASYPCMFGGDRYARRAVSLKRMQNEGESWGFYHEVGHIYQVACWKWGALGEVSNNFHSLEANNRLRGGWSQRSDKWQEFIDRVKEVPLNERNFETNLNFDVRLVPFCQLAQQYGWKLYTYLSTCSRELSDTKAQMITSMDEARREFFCKRVCEYANTDLRPFFDFWGIKYGPFAAADMAKLPPYQGEKFWERWDSALVPDCYKQRTPRIRLSDDNYGLSLGEIIPANWKIILEESAHYISDSKSDGPENMFDGNGNTCWGTPTLTRPVYDKQPMVVIDLGKTETFDFIEMKGRSFHVPRLNCHKFKVEFRRNKRNEWKNVGEFESTQPYGNLPMHYDLDQKIKGRYLRLTLLEGFPEDGQPLTSGGACVSIFKIGETVR